MDRFRNYITAVAGLVILAGAFTVIGPYVDQGQADPTVKDVNVVNTPLPVTGDVLVTNTSANPLPVVVQNGGEPAGEKDVVIVVCNDDRGFGSMLINRIASSRSTGVPPTPQGTVGCAFTIAFYIAEGFTPSGEGSGGMDDQQRPFFFIFMTRNKLP